MNIEEKVMDLIKDALLEKDITVLKVGMERENNEDYLRVYIDAVDIDTCVDATKIINPLLDDADVIEDSYILEVLSKGEENGN